MEPVMNEGTEFDSVRFSERKGLQTPQSLEPKTAGAEMNDCKDSSRAVFSNVQVYSTGTMA